MTISHGADANLRGTSIRAEARAAFGPLVSAPPGMDRIARVVASITCRTQMEGSSLHAVAFDHAVRKVVEHARADDPHRVERLIIPLRKAWRELPEVRALRDDLLREELWEWMLQLCVEEFYGFVRAR